MSTITAPSPTTSPTTSTTPTVRAGLALSALIGLGNLPFLAPGIDWGESEPSLGILLAAAAIGMVSVVCAVIAWNSGNRLALRINAGALIFNAVGVVPGLFLDTTAFIRLVSAVIIIATLAAVIMTMRRPVEPQRVTD